MYQFFIGNRKLQESVQNGFLLSRIFCKPLVQCPLFVLNYSGSDQINGSVFGRKSCGFDIKKQDISILSQKLPYGIFVCCM